MEIRVSSLRISGLILSFITVTIGTSPAVYSGKSSRCLQLNKSVEIYEKIMCGFVHNETFKTDKNNPPIKRKVQLYSRASQLHIQIRKSEVDARGQDGSEYARLVLESDNFRRIRIRGEKANRYLCVTKKGELVARIKKQRFTVMKRCIFNEEITGEGWFQYRSTKYPSFVIGFSKAGRPMNGRKSAKRSKYRQFTLRELPERKHRKHRRNARLLRLRIIRFLRKRLRLR
ncbi:fibroblast growth factor 18-like [Acropora palmata]|uniref:fibroblast growth factor 18-like n=1 Tax=Acropora palmata TaxID=6131 RepID=UPI003DA06973